MSFKIRTFNIIKHFPIALLMSGLLIFSIYFGFNIYKYWTQAFHGTIENLYLAPKGDPVVFINGKEIPLGMFDIELSPIIEIGDSIVKNSHTFCTDLYKRNESNKFAFYKKTCPKFNRNN